MTITDMCMTANRHDLEAQMKHSKEHHQAARDSEAIAQGWRQTAEICSRLDRMTTALESLAEQLGSVVAATSCLVNGTLPR